MADKLQELTERIYQEGVDKAKQEADRILAETNAKAADTLKKAEDDANRIRQEAQALANETRKNVNAELQLAAKQAMSALKQQISELIITKAIDPAADKIWEDSGFLKKMVEATIQNWKEGDESGEIALVFPKNLEKEMDDFFKQSASNIFKQGIKVEYSENLKSGYSIGPADGSFKINFTDEDFANFFKHYLRPRAIKILYGE
ncbi:MAG TPA: V-type ATP synthase subunit E [Candidatus Cloacimonadota bacterium]|nr:V-type ATP synthase subunit E [Candidatus Cloacimonadota bacterium]HPT70793.1 V-type ATP synthase subunit E [Candidatus Cloacimonadota bacterium]